MTNGTLKLDPAARPEAVVRGDTWRVTVLTDRLLRLEHDPAGRFTDSATQTVICRNFPVPAFRTEKRGDVTVVDTGRLCLFYDGGPFSPEGLRVEISDPAHGFAYCWRYGYKIWDLGGRARTLDMADGKIPLESGLMSLNGYTVLDDSRTALIGEDMWAGPRPEGVQDLYFFGYGHDYMGCLRDFFRLSGQPPLLPRFALGNWWSRFHKYSEQSYLALMEQFRARDIPLSVAVVDMDWHPTRLPPRCGSGWTGYTWNSELFPDPERFLDDLHRRGLRVTLNVHPSEGVGAHERAYPQVAQAMGLDPAAGERIPFEVTDRTYMDAYFKYLHHPLEDQGVDFWWVDWQQGTHSAVPGIDPLWMLNHLHYLDSGRDGRWPMTFSRYAGVGSHRYPIGFSGDSFNTWQSLDFQPYFTAAASNVGYTWWSHDIGGHQGGRRDDELTARWVEYGVFSPIMRLHSTDNAFMGKEPWKYGMEAERAMTEHLRLRHRLIPYLYSMNWLTHREGLPLVRPMYYDIDRPEAYLVPNEYWFGTSMIACPITAPADRDTLLGRFDAWLPEGVFYDFFNGRRYTGGRRLGLYRDIRHIPVLVPAGAVIPLDGAAPHNGAENPELIDLLVWPGADGRFEMYEDRGVYGSEPAVTAFSLRWGETAELTAALSGDRECVPPARRYRVSVMGVGAPRFVDAEGWRYDENTRTLFFELAPGREGFTVRFSAETADPDPKEEVFQILSRAQISYELKTRINDIVQRESDLAHILSALGSLALPPEVYGAVTEPLTAALG